MGLLDQLSGSSTLTKALLALLAAKAATSYFGKDDSEAKPAGTPAPSPSASSGTIESGILAGLPSLDSILDTLRGGGLGDKVDSWIGKGENTPVAPHELDKALGPNTLDELAKETGQSKDSLLKELSDALPKVIDKLTPGGSVPGGR